MLSESQYVNELDGLCESPHDDPPKWAAMLTAYFDESFQAGNGHVVVAGFLGSRDCWNQCVIEWRKALGKRHSLHMNKLRWAKPIRNKTLLEGLGTVPHDCGLQPVFASVRLSDYKIAEQVPKTFQNGYYVALSAAVIGLLETIPSGERVELIFEQQVQYAAVREAALYALSIQPYYRSNGQTSLAKWSSAPKSILLEPSDYLAYAIMQALVDKQSIRSRLCSPILKHGKKRIGGKLSEKEVGRIISLRQESLEDIR